MKLSHSIPRDIVDKGKYIEQPLDQIQPLQTLKLEVADLELVRIHLVLEFVADRLKLIWIFQSRLRIKQKMIKMILQKTFFKCWINTIRIITTKEAKIS